MFELVELSGRVGLGEFDVVVISFEVFGEVYF